MATHSSLEKTVTYSPFEYVTDLFDQAEADSCLLLSPELSSFRDELAQIKLEHRSVSPSVLNNVLALVSDIQSVDWIIIENVLEHLPKEDGILLLGALRNTTNAKLLAFQVENSGLFEKNKGLSFNDFIGLGFRKGETFALDHERKLVAYTYNIANYNRKRSWNNAKNWANPEMFGKYWW